MRATALFTVFLAACAGNLGRSLTELPEVVPQDLEVRYAVHHGMSGESWAVAVSRAAITHDVRTLQKKQRFEAPMTPYRLIDLYGTMRATVLVSTAPPPPDETLANDRDPGPILSIVYGGLEHFASPRGPKAKADEHWLGAVAAVEALRDLTTNPAPASRPQADTPPVIADARAWDEALKIAQHSILLGSVEKRTTSLPFLFQAYVMKRCVLVHEGKVVSERGPALAGRYFRALGLHRGVAIPIDDLLWALWALEALPAVDAQVGGPEAYMNVPGDERLHDITAQARHDGRTAHIVLHYFKHEAETRRGGGTIAPNTPPEQRPMIRMTFVMPETGDANWLREDVTWPDPATAGPEWKPPAP